MLLYFCYLPDEVVNQSVKLQVIWDTTSDITVTVVNIELQWSILSVLQLILFGWFNSNLC